MREIDQAPFGIVGLETLIPITVTSLIEGGHLTWPEVLRKLTYNPAQLLGIPKGTLRRRGRRRHDHRPQGALDDRRGQVPLQESQHAVRRLGRPRPRPYRHRRRRGAILTGWNRSAGRRGRAGLRSSLGSRIGLGGCSIGDVQGGLLDEQRLNPQGIALD